MKESQSLEKQRNPQDIAPALKYHWVNPDIDEDSESWDDMEFRLTYEGPLNVNGNAKQKHAIRKHFHPQLFELWRTHNVLNAEMAQPPTPPGSIVAAGRVGEHLRVRDRDIEKIADNFNICGYRFLPLVTDELHLVCGLEILFLRRSSAGDLVVTGGDIDNRMKTLLDALRVPKKCEETHGQPEATENPFYCLLEDDKLISELNITTDRLLMPAPSGGHSKDDVKLVIKVKVQATVLTWLNASFASQL